MSGIVSVVFIVTREPKVKVILSCFSVEIAMAAFVDAVVPNVLLVIFNIKVRLLAGNDASMNLSIGNEFCA